MYGKEIMQAIQARENVITASVTGFTVEQVETVNNLERNADAAGWGDSRYTGEKALAVSVERGHLRVEFEQDEWTYTATVLDDGTLQYDGI